MSHLKVGEMKSANRAPLKRLRPGRWLLLAGLCALLLFPSPAGARVTGICKDCHEMHGDTPERLLTKGGCLGCHGQAPSGTSNIVMVGTSRTPQVLHHMSGGDLAGGNFYYVADGFTTDYTRGHNVEGISQRESPPMDIPPGFLGNVQIPGGRGPVLWQESHQLQCAGTWGCHGDRTIEDPYLSIYGAHHEDDSVIDGTTVGKSYRFLYGIKGHEQKDWEYLVTVNDHNGYKGSVNFSSTDTISYLCGECHGLFHPHQFLGGTSGVGGKTPWHRHPTDISFGNASGGIGGSDFQGIQSYNPEVPVAYDNPRGDETVVDENSIIMCLSCHRAHASPYPDALRWDYTKMFAGMSRSGPGEGCFACHTRK